MAPLAIRTAVGPRAFSARQLVEHARINADLRRALPEADVQTVTDAGYWLRRVRRSGAPNGLSVERVHELRSRARWRITLTRPE